MRRRALEVLACPECGMPFRELSSERDPVEGGWLRCAAGHTSSIEDGIPLLVRTDQRGPLGAFAESYARAWSRDGWGSPDPEYLRDLPYRDRTGRHRMEWRVKARSMDALLATFGTERPVRVVDLGCGIGWLAHHFALRGHEVYAMDVSLDNVLGLGAAGAYVRVGPYFERVWGDLQRPPVLSGSVDAVVCNASLHYSADLGAVLTEISRILRPGGSLVILNSPVYRDAASALRGQTDFRGHLSELGSSEAVASSYHHFVRSELEAATRVAIGPVREIPFNPGVWFRWSRKLKGLVLRMELASFPILVATKRGAGTAPPASGTLAQSGETERPA